METLFFCSLVALMMSLFVLGQAEIKKVKESIEELKEMLEKQNTEQSEKEKP